MAIAHDADSNSGYQSAQSSYSWSHTCGGLNRYLVVGISMLSVSQTVTSITYNSVNLSLLGVRSSVSGVARIELWGLVNPSTGANSIAVTLSGAIASAGNASSYTGVHQSTPTEAFNSNQGTTIGTGSATVDVTTVADNDWCVDVVASDDTAITVGAGQTQTGNVTGTGGSGAMSYEGPKTPAGVVTMSWDSVTFATWVSGSIALLPATAGSSPSSSTSLSISLSPSSSTSSSISLSPSSSPSSSQSPSSSVSLSISLSPSASPSPSSSISPSPSVSVSLSPSLSISKSPSSSQSPSSSVSASPSPSTFATGWSSTTLYFWDGSSWQLVDTTG